MKPLDTNAIVQPDSRQFPNVSSLPLTTMSTLNKFARFGISSVARLTTSQTGNVDPNPITESIACPPTYSADEMRRMSVVPPSTARLHEVSDPLPSPASAVASLTRDLESTLHTLDLQAAMRGQYVVKPQVR